MIQKGDRVVKAASLRKLEKRTAALRREIERRWKECRRSGKTIPLSELRRVRGCP